MVVIEILPSWIEELKESYLEDERANQVLQQYNHQKTLGEGLSVHASIIRKKGRIYVGSKRNWRKDYTSFT
jgi:hypothetical protein